jgi:endonuclease/exonuclease/phosphatase family metal-dependent hydrolase
MLAIMYKLRQLAGCKQVFEHRCNSSNGAVSFTQLQRSLKPDPIYDTYQKGVVIKNKIQKIKEICTWNVQELWWHSYRGNKLDNIIKYISNSTSDVLCLQEVFEPKVIRLLTTHPAISRHFPYYLTGNLCNSYILGENSGLLVLSRYPIIFREFIPFKISAFPDTFASKGALFFTIGEINFITTHLQSINIPVALRQLYHIIKNSPFKGKTILLGDLNIPDPFPFLKMQRNNQGHTHLSGCTLDHIIPLHSDIDFGVEVDYINLKNTSDHYPLIATLR